MALFVHETHSGVSGIFNDLACVLCQLLLFFIFLLLFQIEQSYFIDCNKLGCTGNTENC